MILKIINYIIRFSFIIIGLLFLSGVLFPDNPNQELLKIFGVVFILWGIYRLVTYRTFEKRYNRDKENE